MRCECCDELCPVHRGEECQEEGTLTLYRVDMDDVSGTVFCDECAEDALSSGLYTDELADLTEEEESELLERCRAEFDIEG